MRRDLLKLCLAVGVSAVGLSQSANANLIITPAGAALGFTESQVVTGFPFNGLGPIGITVLPSGNILANSTADSSNYVFADIDNQSFSSHIGAGVPGMSCCGAYATSNGWGWGGQGGHLVRFNNDGTIAQSYPTIGVANGVWTNPVTGSLLIANGSVHNVNVSNINAPVDNAIPGTSAGDGLTVSPDGTTVYTSTINGYLISSGANVFSHFVSGADGMGIISSNNSLNGDIVVNTTVGNVVLVDPTGANPDVIIANNGQRGDYTTPDPNGTLLLTQGNEIDRLSCGADCGIGTVVSAPEPASLLLISSGLFGLAALRRRKRG